MRYVIVPIEDAKVIFTDKELSTMRKSVDNTQVIVHEEILLRKRVSLGLDTLSNSETYEWTYPVYEYNTPELNNLLSSNAWSTETNL